MIRRITKTLLIAAIVIGLVQTGQSVCLGWSLNPFTSNEQAQTRTVSMTKTTQKPPSAWEKVTTGTKNIFNKTGETLGLKKKEPKKAPAVVAPKPRTLVPKAKEPSGIAGWFTPKQEKPKTVPSWMDGTKPIVP